MGTPIGNLEDMTPRAARILNEADVILCEDTRVGSKLLSALGIKKSLLSWHQHSDSEKFFQIKSKLEAGKNLAFISDAGTPGISDPGGELVARLVEEGFSVSAAPGVSALTCALSISGFPADKFVFSGFPPHKNKRRKFFVSVAESEHTLVFYEAASRVRKALAELAEFCPERPICLCRELTKKFESVYRGSVQEVTRMEFPEKGEFVAVLGPKKFDKNSIYTD